tara:strand:- start:75 stop:701 length:627 start_codon:yes stop_codon:yes gene_type:complete
MNKGLLGHYTGEMAIARPAPPKNPANRNCIFIIQSGSMIASGRTELVAKLMFEFATMDGASSADVYANDDGKVMYLGNISSHTYSNEPIAIPYGGGEGWTNANILAGFVETYNHTFIFDDGDMMPEMAVAILERVHPDKAKDFNLIHISNECIPTNKRVMSIMDRAEELNINRTDGRWILLPYVTTGTQRAAENNGYSAGIMMKQFED